MLRVMISQGPAKKGKIVHSTACADVVAILQHF